ncbi:MAG: DMT family transporter [Hydrogenibacillus schlegelii]|uniref:DMT family transporter n=1 Tax=Hydrogenibacillus schlegelii TaxID=1484 RepID=A0A947CUQ5_HYDSH|nr:DMT family transporter [Hydrogenibacillus schlegelii]
MGRHGFPLAACLGSGRRSEGPLDGRGGRRGGLYRFFCIGAGFSLWFWLLDRLNMATAPRSVPSVPVPGLFFGALFLGEWLTAPLWVGSALILVGVGLAHAALTDPRNGFA